jgi:phenylalanyl-tRNA synthetase alpha chain
MAEALQQFILDELQAHSAISDTRSLVLPGTSGPATSQDAQITILGALNSLLSRDVSTARAISVLILLLNCQIYSDG